MTYQYRFCAVFKNLKLSFSEDNMPVHALDVFVENATKMVRSIPFNAKIALNLDSTKNLYFPIQCNGNYWDASRNVYNAYGCDGYRFP